VSPDRVLELKVDAKRIKAERGVKQSVALDIVAQAEGFRTWMDLTAEAGGKAAVREAKHDQQPTEARLRRAERYADHLRRVNT